MMTRTVIHVCSNGMQVTHKLLVNAFDNCTVNAKRSLLAL